MTAGRGTGGSRGRPRDPEADSAILRAALELFLEGGVDGTSIEQVAKQAGVGKLTVYRRWSDKVAMIAAAIEFSREQVEVAPVEDVSDVPVAELVERSLPAVAEAVTEPRFRALVARVLGSSVSHPQLMATYWEHYVLPRRRVVRDRLERAKRENALPAGTDVDVVMDMLIGAMMHRLLRSDPPDAAEMRDYLRTAIRHVTTPP
jgi:AcrR family transcriptional regulator